MRRLILLSVLLVCGAPCAWAQLSVISSRPESVAITAYRQGVAQITESRQVELPAGPVTLVFEGVVDTLLPQSAVISGADRALVETNFDYDQLSPASLLERSVGRTVTLVRTNRSTGAVVRQAATIVSASGEDGVVFRTVEGNEALKCSGLPERLEFNEIPAGLRTTPTLSVRLAAGVPGKRSVTLSYLVHGITWSADYVAKLNQKSNRMDLSGWATLTNDTSVNFDRAQVQLISGELEVIGYYDGGSRPARRGSTVYRDEDEPEVERQAEPAAVLPLEKCTPPAPPEYTGLSKINYAELYPVSSSTMSQLAMISTREPLSDYVLYRLPEPTDLKSRQTKQVMFLRKPSVKVERFYRIWSRDFTEDADEEDADFGYSLRGPEVGLGWRNDTSGGLGEPMPEGTLRIFERFSGREVFAGASGINDIPVGLSAVVFYAQAQGVADDRIRTPEPEYSDDKPRLSVAVEHHLRNDKRVPVTIVVLHTPDYFREPPRLLKSNLRPMSPDGDPRWLVRMPAGSRRVLRYELEADNPYYEPPED